MRLGKEREKMDLVKIWNSITDEMFDAPFHFMTEYDRKLQHIQTKIEKRLRRAGYCVQTERGKPYLKWYGYKL